MTDWQSWAWHLTYDPIHGNPWAAGIVGVLVVGSVLGSAVAVGGIYQMWPIRRRETVMATDRRRAGHAIANARQDGGVTTATMDVREVEQAFPLPPADPADWALGLRRVPTPPCSEVAVPTAHPGIVSTCTQCAGHGTIARPVVDLLAESLGLVTDPAALATAPLSDGDDWADPLFPVDTLAALAHLYDPNERESLARLGATLASIAARRSAEASLDEYMRTKVLLLAAFRESLGERWRPEYAAAWSQAYDYAAARMLATQQEAVLEGFAMGRYPGTVQG